jgi:hypothetical protein
MLTMCAELAAYVKPIRAAPIDNFADRQRTSAPPH